LNPIFAFFFNQTFGWADLAVIALLAVLEGALSIDNALVLGLLAKRLKKDEQGRALNIGMFLAFLFRFVAIFAAALLLRYTFVKLLGGGYLVYIAVRHLFFETKQLEEGKIELDEHGNPVLLETTGHDLTEAENEKEIRGRVPVYVKPQTVERAGFAQFWPTVGSIGLTDIAFAVDSILAAIALIGPPPPGATHHPKLWVVFVGAALGMIALRFAAGLVIRLLENFPRFEIAAYLLVLVIGLKLLGDWGFNSDWSTWSPGFENWRVTTADRYEKWLSEKWIFKIKPHEQHPAEEKAPIPAAGEDQPAPGAVAPAPQAQPVPKNQPLQAPRHLLDFHDPRRPEFMVFWLSMIMALASGFIPPRKRPHAAAAPA